MQKGVWLATLPLVVALAACMGREDKAQENVLPTRYKSEVIEMIRGQLDDPTNIREAGVSEPTLRPMAGSMRYVVCVRYNPKDHTGRYMGVKTAAAIFFSGHITQLVAATNEQCGGAMYQPFPELQKLCRTVGCVEG